MKADSFATEASEGAEKKHFNLHSLLLPSFKGAHAIADAYDAGVKVTGITVHFANEDYDKGPIVAQRAVEVREDDTLEALEARIHDVEHRLYPHVLGLIARGAAITADGVARVDAWVHTPQPPDLFATSTLFARVTVALLSGRPADDTAVPPMPG